MDVGNRIVQLRTSKGITTNKLANLAGISQSYLREIELGRKNPTIEILSYICYGLQTTLHNFFAEEKEEINPFLLSAVVKLTNEEQLKLADFLSELKSSK